MAKRGRIFWFHEDHALGSRGEPIFIHEHSVLFGMHSYLPVVEISDDVSVDSFVGAAREHLSAAEECLQALRKGAPPAVALVQLRRHVAAAGCTLWSVGTSEEELVKYR